MRRSYAQANKPHPAITTAEMITSVSIGVCEVSVSMGCEVSAVQNYTGTTQLNQPTERRLTSPRCPVCDGGALATNPVAGKYLDAPAGEKEEGPGEVDRRGLVASQRPWGVQIEATPNYTALHHGLSLWREETRARGSSPFFENAAPQEARQRAECAVVNSF
jgi:hypothetical protein